MLCLCLSLVVMLFIESIVNESYGGTNGLTSDTDTNSRQPKYLNPFAKPFAPSCLISTMISEGSDQMIDPWDCSIYSDSSTNPIPQNISTPTNIQNKSIRQTHSTPMDLSLSDLNPQANPFILILANLSLNDTSIPNISENMSKSKSLDEPMSILSELKEKNSERPIIAHLNINSVSSKFEPLASLIQDNIDLLVVTESKLDDTFPQGQFNIDGFAKPIRLDRNRYGGGIIIFTRNGLTCHELKPRTLYPDLECTFLELRIRQSKWLIVAGYNPNKKEIGPFLSKLSKEIDQHLPKYENLIMLGDWNSAVTEDEMEDFCEMYKLENLVKEPTCFKSNENPSSIDIILTNKKIVFKILL